MISPLIRARVYINLSTSERLSQKLPSQTRVERARKNLVDIFIGTNRVLMKREFIEGENGRYLIPLVRTVLDSLTKLIWLSSGDTELENNNRALVSYAVQIRRLLAISYPNQKASAHREYEKILGEYNDPLAPLPADLLMVNDKKSPEWAAVKAKHVRDGLNILQGLDKFHNLFPIASRVIPNLSKDTQRIWGGFSLYVHGEDSVGGIHGKEPHWTMSCLLVPTAVLAELLATLANVSIPQDLVSETLLTHKELKSVWET